MTPDISGGETTFTYSISDEIAIDELTGSATGYYIQLEADAFLDNDAAPMGNVAFVISAYISNAPTLWYDTKCSFVLMLVCNVKRKNGFAKRIIYHNVDKTAKIVVSRDVHDRHLSRKPNVHAVKHHGTLRV